MVANFWDDFTLRSFGYPRRIASGDNHYDFSGGAEADDRTLCGRRGGLRGGG